MTPWTCAACGLTGQSLAGRERVCAVCAQKDRTQRHPLADAPPMPIADIEAIKVQMLQMDWTWGQS